ncbi:septum formation family protein [Dactylosporangium sp. NPDC005572]|uniref:septum formation family protein n=1 Tax=Dactylosporangium sp. NPDC005572 TaxID=3156889 RepID=UPI0033A8DBDE
MSRALLRVAALLACASIALAACTARPAGADGNLVDDWAPLAEPAFLVPSAGTCLDASAHFAFEPRWYRTTPIECDRGHSLETVLTGTVTGTAAAGSKPPEWGSEANRAAFAECGRAVTAYVGGDWHNGLLGIHVLMPTDAQWDGGLRSYTCAAFVISDVTRASTIIRSGTLRDGLSGAAPLALRCLDQVGAQGAEGFIDGISAITAIDCAQPHDTEYAGLATMPDGQFPSDQVMEGTLLNKCWGRAASLLGLTENQLSARRDIRVTWDGISQAQWTAGDRTARCFAVVSYRTKVKASLKGLGKGKLPV